MLQGLPWALPSRYPPPPAPKKSERKRGREDSEVDECLFLEPKMCVKCSLVLIDSLLSGPFKQLDLSDASKAFGCWGIILRMPILSSRLLPPHTGGHTPFTHTHLHTPHLLTPGPHWPAYLMAGTPLLGHSAGQVTCSSQHLRPKDKRPGASGSVPCWKLRNCLRILPVVEHSSYGEL